jgi:hypothetical protein
LNAVKGSASNPALEHPGRVEDFNAWLQRPSKSPRELVNREKIRSILGLASKP